MTSLLARIGAALAVALCGDALAASQMYKCIEGSRTVYQQQPCNPQAEAAASAPRAAAPASAASDAGSAAAKKIRRPSPASSAPATPR
jgi:hypothetical protein